jgi:hypothetical protein
MDNNQDHERRRFRRILFDAPALLVREDRDFSTKLVDISLNGALVLQPEDWDGKSDDELRLTVMLDSQESTCIHMEATVAHIDEGEIGLRCRHIDMDSITHLRRLVELNLGDADLLQRELEALG